jgi:hypothetical protein
MVALARSLSTTYSVSVCAADLGVHRTCRRELPEAGEERLVHHVAQRAAHRLLRAHGVDDALKPIFPCGMQSALQRFAQAGDGRSGQAHEISANRHPLECTAELPLRSEALRLGRQMTVR